jgi:hypothetical protein
MLADIPVTVTSLLVRLFVVTSLGYSAYIAWSDGIVDGAVTLAKLWSASIVLALTVGILVNLLVVGGYVALFVIGCVIFVLLL